MNNKPIEKLNYNDYPVGHKELWDKQCEIIDRLNAMGEANKPAKCFGDMVKEMYKTPNFDGNQDPNYPDGYYKKGYSDVIKDLSVGMENKEKEARIEGKIEILHTLKVDADEEIARLKEQNK